ncbi:hypothetical protein BC826DRAFT_966599 [Russula brevipes]|nr:hypothetical protein BC826DRAFT_966599 [Russula brevipes]
MNSGQHGNLEELNVEPQLYRTRRTVMTLQFAVHEVDGDITAMKNLLSSAPRSDPMRPVLTHTLAMAQTVRHERSGQEEYLNEAILHRLHFTEVIFLPFAEQSLDIVQTSSLFRVVESVPTLLVQGLAVRVKSNAGDAMDGLEEMVSLCRGLLASDFSAGYPTTAITSLTGALLTVFNRWEEVSLALAMALHHRFVIAFSSSDHEEATVLLNKVIASNPSDADSHVLASCLPDTLRPAVAEVLAVSAGLRVRHFGLPEDTEGASSGIAKIFGFLSSGPLHTSGRGVVELDAVRAAYSMTEIESNIQHLHERLSTITPGTRHHIISLDNLADWYETKSSRTHGDDLLDIEEAIKYRRRALSSTSLTDLSRFHHLMSLGNVLFMAFKHGQKSEYLDESISMQSEALAGQSLQPGRFNVLHRLLMALITRFLSRPLAQDLDEIIRLFPMAVDDAYAGIPDRFEHSCLWALFARMRTRANEGNGSARRRGTRIGNADERRGFYSVGTRGGGVVSREGRGREGMECRASGAPAWLIVLNAHAFLIAYKNPMSLMKSALDFAPTLQLQHARLVKMRGTCEKMPLDYASYQIDTGRYEEAIETLEQGRALLWSEMRGFRSFISRLHAADPALAGKFAAVNKEHEILTTSIAPGGNVEPDQNGVGLEGDEEMDPFGRLVVKQQALVEEREKLASQIQTLPGFEGFLKRPSFDYLRSAAPRNRAEGSAGEPVNTRKEHRLESKQYQRAIRSVLEGLYELVGRPVIEELHKLNIPVQSRVWWCPTSVFCSLPSTQWVQFHPTTVSIGFFPRMAGDLAHTAPSLEGDDAYLKEGNTLWRGGGSPGSPGNRLTLRSSFMGASALRCWTSCDRDFANAEFAFLSACHTAEMADGSIADEALHLAAAVQYCGFRSVVGTMWATADVDGGQGLVEDSTGRHWHSRAMKNVGRAPDHITRELRRHFGTQWGIYEERGAYPWSAGSTLFITVLERPKAYIYKDLKDTQWQRLGLGGSREDK